MRLASQGGFDSFNPILGSIGHRRPGLGYLNETLMASSFDELNISAVYGLLAEAMKYPGGFLQCHLPAAARRPAGTTASR